MKNVVNTLTQYVRHISNGGQFIIHGIQNNHTPKNGVADDTGIMWQMIQNRVADDTKRGGRWYKKWVADDTK